MHGQLVHHLLTLAPAGSSGASRSRTWLGAPPDPPILAPRLDCAAVSDKIVTIDSRQFEVSLERDGATLTSGGHVLDVIAVRDDELELRVDGRRHIVPFVVQGPTVYFSFEGETYVADVSDKGARARVRHRDHSTSAPMPGVVLKILVRQGDVVAKGAPLLILEAMKMEHQIAAGHDATVLSVNCTEGELVQPGVELVTLSDEDPR